VRTEFVVNAAFVAFAEQIEIGFAKSWQKGIGITSAVDLTGFVGNDEVVGIDATAVLGCAFEDFAFGDALKLDGRFVFFVDGLDFDFGGVRDESAGDKAGTVVEGMQAQQAMGRMSLKIDETTKFFLGQKHRGE